MATSALTGPEAPHDFRICRRKHLGTLTACGDGTAEAATCHRAEHRGHQPNGNDVVMVAKDRLASLEVSQIILMVPAAHIGRLHYLPLQPQCTHRRRPASKRGRKRLHDAALMVHRAGAINRKACNYLSHWAQRTRRAPAETFLLPFPGNQVRGASPRNLVLLDLEEQCHVFLSCGGGCLRRPSSPANGS